MKTSAHNGILKTCQIAHPQPFLKIVQLLKTELEHTANESSPVWLVSCSVHIPWFGNIDIVILGRAKTVPHLSEI
jgi:hypothetical protein